MRLPKLRPLQTSLDGTVSFSGLNHNLIIRSDEFYDMKNMTGTLLPVISSRGKRATVRKIQRPNGLFAHGKLCWVDGTSFYFGGKKKADVTDGPKQIIRQGAWVIVFPDGMRYNTHTDVVDYLDNEVRKTDLNFAMCMLNGENYDYVISDTAPKEPKNGDYWLDTSGKDKDVMRLWSDVQMMWQSVATVYIKITGTGVGHGFKKNDGVTISGIDRRKELNGSYYLVDAGEDFVIIVGLIREAFRELSTVKISRKRPEMDFVCESGNRVWGCSNKTHEIFASALGDATNFNQFLGLAGDSYAVTVGTTGDFTGCCAHAGSVLFFKEDSIQEMLGNKPANFQSQTIQCRGVAEGSERSICHVNETLLYRGVNDVLAFGQSMPADVGNALGKVRYVKGVGGALDQRYYLCLEKEDRTHELLVFDTEQNVWMKEDDLNVLYMAALGQELYMLCDEGRIISVNGGGVDEYGDGTSEVEPDVEWMLETGDLGIGSWSKYNGVTGVCAKWVSGVQLHVELELGSTVVVKVQYDNEDIWQEAIRVKGVKRKDMVLPIIPKRHRVMRIRIEGNGAMRLYTLTRKVEMGSDVYQPGGN